MRARAAWLLFLALSASAGIAACGGSPSERQALLPLGASGARPQKRVIKHVVIVIQENRSFDNLFATFPGADGATTGRAAAMPAPIASACAARGQRVIAHATTVALKKVSLIGNGQDLDHIHTGFALDYDGGKMDGFDLAGYGPNGKGAPTCLYTYQYVDPAQIRPYWDIAKRYVLADHLFQTQGSGSFTAHQDLIAGGTDVSASVALIDNPTGFPWGCDATRRDKKKGIPGSRTAIIKKGSDRVYPYAGPFPCLKYPTLRDLLDAKGVSWKYYTMKVVKPPNGDTPGIWSAFDAIHAVRYGPEWTTHVTQTNVRLFEDITNGELPAVSWVTPDALNSDHPGERTNGGQGELRDTGPSWIAAIVNAIGKSSYWDSTAVIVLWDDWGGYYDHLAPPMPRNWQGGPGFRVPMLVISPYVKPHVDHTSYEFGSILRFVEENWSLGSLGTNDKASVSISNVFDFHLAPRKFEPIAAKYSRSYFLHQQPSGLPPDTE